MPYFSYYLPDNTPEDGPYFSYQPVSGVDIPVKRPPEMEMVEPDEIKLIGTYIAEAFDEDGALLDISSINILENIIVTATPDLDVVSFAGFYTGAAADISIDFRMTQGDSNLLRVTSFNDAPMDAYACVGYQAPMDEAVLIRYTFDILYNGSPEISYFYVFVLTNYCRLNEQFINGVLELGKEFDCVF